MAIRSRLDEKVLCLLPAQRGENETLSVPDWLVMTQCGLSIWPSVQRSTCRPADQFAYLEARGEPLCFVSRLMGTEEGSRGSRGGLTASLPGCEERIRWTTSREQSPEAWQLPLWSWAACAWRQVRGARGAALSSWSLSFRHLHPEISHSFLLSNWVLLILLFHSCL